MEILPRATLELSLPFLVQFLPLKLVESDRVFRIDSSYSESLLILAYPNGPSHPPGLASRASFIGPGMQSSRG